MHFMPHKLFKLIRIWNWYHGGLMGVLSPIKTFQNGQREETKVPEVVITPEEAHVTKTIRDETIQGARHLV